MIDLTPLDVRNKRGDFKRQLRGYDPQEVDGFLELVAERLDQLVMEVLKLRERSENLQAQVASQSGREKAVQEALVTAQELRSEMRTQAQKQADLILNEARTEARRMAAEAEAEAKAALRKVERGLELGHDALEEMERRRVRFLKQFRQLLERELDVVSVEEEREPLEDRAIELDLGGGRSRTGDDAAREARAAFESALGSIEAPGETPLDASVEDLAAAYGGAADTDMRTDRGPSEDGTLSLSFDDTTPDDDDTRRP